MTEEYKRFAIIDDQAVTDVSAEPVDWSKFSQDTQYFSQPIEMVVCSGLEHLGKGIPTVSEKRHCGVVTIDPTTGTPEQYRDYIVADEAPFIPNVGTIGVTEELTEKERDITVTGSEPTPADIINSVNDYLCKDRSILVIGGPTRPLAIPTLSLSDKVLFPIIKQPHPFDRFIPNSPTSHRWKSRR